MTIKRGCGTRKTGGLYMMSDSGPDGMPLEYFLFDPTRPIDPSEIGLSANGMAFIETPDRTVDVYDWIGAGSGPASKGYWNTLDYIKEGQIFGFSALISPSFPLEVLTPLSRRMCIHPHANLINAADYYTGRPDKKLCPNGYENHINIEPGFDDTCVSLLWECIEGGEHISEQYPRLVQRDMPSFSYQAWTHPAHVKPIWRPALFMWLPIHRFEIVRDLHAGRHEETLRRFKASGAPFEVDVVEE